jgi:pantetheine-phosphate adenylyltransferase
VDYVKKVQANAILRGLRAISDFEYEFPMSLMNRNLSEEVETFFLMTGLHYSYISSSVIKDVVSAGGCVSGLVPEPVEKKLKERLLKDAGDCQDMPRLALYHARPEPVLQKLAS